MLRLDRIVKRLAGSPVLTGVSLDVTAGECVVITGPTGATSALLRIAATLIPPDAGTVHIDGIDAVRDLYRARPRVAYVGPGSLPLAKGVRLGDVLSTASAGRALAGTTAHFAAVLDDIGGDSSQPVAALAPAVRQALAIALALDSRVPVVLVDDPFGALDGAWAARVNDWVAVASQAGTAVVVTASAALRVDSRCTRIVDLES